MTGRVTGRADAVARTQPTMIRANETPVAAVNGSPSTVTPAATATAGFT